MESTECSRIDELDGASSRHDPLLLFQQNSKIFFNDISLLKIAFTHRSYINEAHDPGIDNERLEFLGDSVLGLCIAHILFEHFSESREGDLARLKGKLASELTLAQIAQELEIGRFLRLGKGEEMSGGREKTAILADTLEAVLGAYYLDSGIEASLSLIQRLFSERIKKLSSTSGKDFKSIMQEYAQKRGFALPVYTVTRSEGPEHARLFYVSCFVAGTNVGPFAGHTKKEAEQRAAEKAFQLFYNMSVDDARLLSAIAGDSTSINVSK